MVQDGRFPLPRKAGPIVSCITWNEGSAMSYLQPGHELFCPLWLSRFLLPPFVYITFQNLLSEKFTENHFIFFHLRKWIPLETVHDSAVCLTMKVTLKCEECQGTCTSRDYFILYTAAANRWFLRFSLEKKTIV